MSIVTPGIFYYMSTKEFSVSVIIAGAVSGMIVSLIGIICARVFKPLSADETNDRLIAIIEEDFPAVKQLKKNNFSEYNPWQFRIDDCHKGCKGCRTGHCAMRSRRLLLPHRAVAEA